MTLLPRIGDAMIPQSAHKSTIEGRIQKDIEVILGMNSYDGAVMPYLFTPGRFDVGSPVGIDEIDYESSIISMSWIHHG